MAGGVGDRALRRPLGANCSTGKNTKVGANLTAQGAMRIRRVDFRKVLDPCLAG